MSPSTAGKTSRFAAKVETGTERESRGVESGKGNSVEFGVTVAVEVVIVVQHAVEGRDTGMFGIGSMLMDPGTDMTGPLTIPDSEVLGQGVVVEVGIILIGAAGGATGGSVGGGAGIGGWLVGSALVEHVLVDNKGYGNKVAELDRHGHEGEAIMGNSLDG